MIQLTIPTKSLILQHEGIRRTDELFDRFAGPFQEFLAGRGPLPDSRGKLTVYQVERLSPAGQRFWKDLEAAHDLLERYEAERAEIAASFARARAQRILDAAELGRLHKVEIELLTSASQLQLAAAAKATLLAYPRCSIAGGLYLLTDKPASFDELWPALAGAGGGILARLALAMSEDPALPDTSRQPLPLGGVQELSKRHERLLGLNDEELVSFLTAPMRFVLTHPAPQEQGSWALGFAVALADELFSEPASSDELAALASRCQEGDVDAQLRVGRAAVAASLSGEEASPGLLQALARTSPALRIALVRPGGPQQPYFRELLAKAIATVR